MNEEELKAKEEELKAKEEELKAKEAELEDTKTLIKELKDGYEEKLVKQEEKYNKKLTEQKDVIKQLLLGGDANNPLPTIIDKINARRSAQNKKW